MLLLILATAAQAELAARYTFNATPGKLPKEVVPLQYSAHVVPDLVKNTFSGTQEVELEVLRMTHRLMLNVDNLEIDAASLSGEQLPEQPLTPQIDQLQQTLTFILEQPLKPGIYRLNLKFRGVMSHEGRGLHTVPYQDGDQKKTMIATTLQPTDARRLLPTWDEPSFRARFKLTVDVPASFTAYSNTAVEHQEQLANGWQRISFGVTPPMSSYLMVLVAGELTRLSASHDGVDIGIVTTEGKQASAAFALDSTQTLLRYYGDYLGLPYPLAKLDQIALPGGYSGAMENWGGIIYNEAILLYDPQKSPRSTQQTSFVINAHEVAHMWFGDLVTMAWWDNLWLNEGFASWISMKAAEHLHPDWHLGLENQIERDGVMNLDALKTTHPIQTPVLNEEQAAGNFDQITYGKGEALVRMLEAYLGQDAFQRGIRAYMREHQYGNTTAADLWAALTQASGQPVEALAESWIHQPGFPLVSVAQRCEHGQRIITLSQEPFWLDEQPNGARQWSIPIQLGRVGAPPETIVLKETSITLSRVGCEGALLVDPDNVGYYRVQYDQPNFVALREQVQQLPEATRVKLLTDTWALVTADRLPLVSYLSLVSQYQSEPRLAIWNALLSRLGALERIVTGQPEHPLLQRYINELIASKLNSLGATEKATDSTEEIKLRASLTRELALAGDQALIAQAQARFQRFLIEPDSLAPEAIDWVMSVVGNYASGHSYENLRQLALNAQNAEERNRYELALSKAQDPELAARSLQAILLPPALNPLSSQVVSSVAGSGHLHQAWMFAVLNRDALINAQDAIGRNRFFPSIVGTASDSQFADMLEEFVLNNFSADAQSDARRTAAVIRTRARQKERLLPQTSAALKEPLP